MAKAKTIPPAAPAVDPSPAAPAKPPAKAKKAQKPQVEGITAPKVSNPDTDFSAKVVSMNFLPRAGTENYAQELQERLKDVADETLKGVYYLLPVKLPKAVYERLLKGALAMAEANPAWTERDHLEALVNFVDAKLLTPSGDKA